MVDAVRVVLVHSEMSSTDILFIIRMLHACCQLTPLRTRYSPHCGISHLYSAGDEEWPRAPPEAQVKQVRLEKDICVFALTCLSDVDTLPNQARPDSNIDLYPNAQSR